MKEAAEALARKADELGDKIVGMTAALDHLDQRTSRGEKITIAVVFGLALDLVLSIAVAILLAQQFATSTQLQLAINRETATRQQAICPLYALLLGSYNPDSRAAGPDRDKYNSQFVIMRDAYTTLDCLNPIVPPRIDQPSAPPIPPR